MKYKILILCKDYPPTNRIAGKRPYAWFKYLPEFGVEATVVTATPGSEGEDASRLHRVDCHLENLDASVKRGVFFILMRKIRSFFEYGLPYFLPRTSRYYPIYKKARELLETEKFDCILATGEPFVLFRFAADLSDEFSIPWIPDYRDNWSNDPKRNIATTSHYFDWLYKHVERRLLKRTQHAITVGDAYADNIRILNERVQVYIVKNGHDIPADFKPATPPQDRLVIAHIGRLYKHRDPSIFFRGVSKWLESGDRIPLEIRFIGIAEFPNQESEVLLRAGALADIVTTTPALPYPEMLHLASESHAFLYLSDPQISHIGGKLFDYLGLGRPILAIRGDREVNEIIAADNCGFIGIDEIEIATILEELERNIQDSEFFETAVPLEKYSRRSGAKKLAEIIAEICAG